MLPGTWSVLIDGSGSAVLSQAAGHDGAWQQLSGAGLPALPAPSAARSGGLGRGRGSGGLHRRCLLLSPRPQLSDPQGLFADQKSDGAG